MLNTDLPLTPLDTTTEPLKKISYMLFEIHHKI